MDEVLTPDSSRYWPLEGYQEGANPPSYDKQFVRDWLEQRRWAASPGARRHPRPNCRPR
jgi:phosphoribosylaminoimidazole-succinocarboxamide synthase